MMNSAYAIHLSYNNQEEGWQIPVNPESIEIKDKGQGKGYSIVGQGGGLSETRAGEINVILSPQLKEISFSSIFPAVEAGAFYPYLTSNIVFEPMKYVLELRKWMETKRPIRFVYTNGEKPWSGINIPASIESFEWRESAGVPGEIEYSLSLKEYVFYAARRVRIVNTEEDKPVAVTQQEERPDERVTPRIYIVQPGDNLTKIAIKHYKGESGYWRDIQLFNDLPMDALKELPLGLAVKLPRFALGPEG